MVLQKLAVLLGALFVVAMVYFGDEIQQVIALNLAPRCEISQVNMSVNPNPVVVGEEITFRVEGQQGSTWIEDEWTGGVDCSGHFWGDKRCRTTSTGDFLWRHRWRNTAENDIWTWSELCERSISFTVTGNDSRVGQVWAGGGPYPTPTLTPQIPTVTPLPTPTPTFTPSPSPTPPAMPTPTPTPEVMIQDQERVLVIVNDSDRVIRVEDFEVVDGADPVVGRVLGQGESVKININSSCSGGVTNVWVRVFFTLDGGGLRHSSGGRVFCDGGGEAISLNW